MLILAVLNSCKKDILTPEKTEKRNGIKKDYIKLEKVNLELFIKELGTKSPTGLNEFNKGKKFKGQVSFSTSSQTSIVLETDSISKIQNRDHTTFTIPIKLASKYAVNFQNLIIDIDKGKTTLFLITFIPDKAYKQNFREGKKPFFTGRIIRSPFNLANSSIGTLANPSGPATVSGVVCTTTTYISGVEEVLCDGVLKHHVNDPDAANCGADNPAHFEFTYGTSLDCNYEDGGNGNGGNGGDGGGGPTPYPPLPGEMPVSAYSGTPIVYPSPPSYYEPCPEDGTLSTSLSCGETPIPYSGLTISLQSRLELSTEQSDLLNLNQKIAEKIDLLLFNSRLADGSNTEALKSLIRADIDAILAGTNVYMDPSNNSTAEMNNFTTVNYDNNDYGSYQQNDAWPTIKNVIPPEQFVEHRKVNGVSVNCMILAREQLAAMGFDISDYDALGQTYNINTLQGGTNKAEAAKAVNYLKSKLLAGIPVLVGVDYAPGSPGNPDGKADHFVVITGMGSSGQTKYFTFYDSATDSHWDGPSSRNILLYDPVLGRLRGITQAPYPTTKPLYRNDLGEVIYTVTHVRKTK